MSKFLLDKCPDSFSVFRGNRSLKPGFFATFQFGFLFHMKIVAKPSVV